MVVKRQIAASRVLAIRLLALRLRVARKPMVVSRVLLVPQKINNRIVLT
ncbi:MAG: hypothetical protein IJF46_05335 [Bacteroidaceae bacterium]|nr:hypothetical protein [Bacteroidaceae bacterium]